MKRNKEDNPSVSSGSKRKFILDYSLTADEADGVTLYGVSVVMISPDGSQSAAELRELTSDRELACRILGAMRRGRVTPIAAPGVVWDMLAEDVISRAEAKPAGR